MKVKEESEKAGLKLSIQETCIQSWHTVPSFRGKWMGVNGNIDRLYFPGLQNHCRWWLQTWNLKTTAPWKKKTMTNLDSILKSRDITLLTQVHIVKSMVFPVVTYRCELDLKEGWVLRNWYFLTLVVKKTPESPLTAKRSNQSIQKEINPDYSLEGEAEALIIWPPVAKSRLTGKDWCWERLQAGGEGKDMMSPTQWMWVWANSVR